MFIPKGPFDYNVSIGCDTGFMPNSDKLLS